MFKLASFRRDRVSTLAFVLVVVLLLLPSLAAAKVDQVENLSQSHSWQKRYPLYPNPTDPDLLACETPKSGDLYGLGVRLGIYFQWFTAWVASSFIEDEIAGALDGNAIFLLAISISASRSLYSKELFQIDALVLLELCAGTVVGVLSIWGYRTCWYRKEGTAGIRHFGGFGTHLRLLLATAVAMYSLWFWSRGIEGAIPENTTPDARLHCDQINVLTLNVRGNVKYVALALGSISTLYCGAMVLASFLAAYARVVKVFRLTRMHRWASSTKLRYHTGFNEKELNFLSRFMCVFSMAWIIFAMTFVELTLNQNKVFGVLGENGKILEPAQLLPMLIGAFSFIRILFIAFELWRNPDDTTPSLGYSSSFRAVRPREGSTHGVKLFKLFSPSLAEDSSMALKKTQSRTNSTDSRRDAYSNHHKQWERFIVAWLPWVSLLDSWPLKNYKFLNDDEATEPQSRPQTNNDRRTQSPTNYGDDEDEDEDNHGGRNVRFEDTRIRKGLTSTNLDHNDSVSDLHNAHHVKEWSAVDSKAMNTGSASLTGATMFKSQPTPLDEIPLETPVSPVHIRDFQHPSYGEVSSTATSYERRAE